MQPRHYQPLPQQESGTAPAAAQGMQPVVFYQERINSGCCSNQVESYQERQSRFAGKAQIVCGSLCIAAIAVDLEVATTVGGAVVAPAIWNGILFIIAGAFGIAASKSRAKCQVVAFMVLSIISAVFSLFVLIIAIEGIIKTKNSPYPSAFNKYNSKDATASYLKFMVSVAMEALLVILAVLEAAFAIWGAVICCKAVCCCQSSNTIPSYQQTSFENPMQASFQTTQVPVHVVHGGNQHCHPDDDRMIYA